VQLNLTGVFHGMKAGAPLILESGGGSIVSTASISGTRPAAGEASSAAAKAAVVALTASDVTDVVVFLCSEQARFVNGQNVVVDAGMTLHGSGVDGLFERFQPLLPGF
jgi:NAD(P)-dependent dehydrogenase (short-subunit alcohol dehydrogenase family)